MVQLQWDAVGERVYETGVDHGVLYIPDAVGNYSSGFAWNGLVTVTEAPTGAEANPQYADNLKYINLLSAEEFGATIEAFTYPTAFEQCDGTAVVNGVRLGQQSRKTFGMAYRSLVGNDLAGTDAGYKLHLIYGALAAPSEKAYGTVNDSPEAITFSWEITTTPVPVTGFKPTAILTIDSTKVDADALADLEEALYGTAGTDPRLPQPDEVIALFAGSVTTVTPTTPSFVAGTGIITIPSVTGVQYRRSDTNQVVTGTVTITTPGSSLLIKALPIAGYKLNPATDNDWSFTRTP